MTTRVWKGGTASFFNPTAWTPAGRPVSGNDLDIVSGTAEVSWTVLRGLSIRLGETPVSGMNAGPAVLHLRNSVIASDTTIAVGGLTLGASNSGLPSGTLEAAGFNVNLGTISVAGFSPVTGGFPSSAQLTIDVGGGRGGATFFNAGTLRTGNTPATLVLEAPTHNAMLENDGLIEAGSIVKLDLDVIGVGKIQFGAPYPTGPSPHAYTGPTIATTGAVSVGQTIDFKAASGADSMGTLSIDDPQDFHALISDFAFTPFDREPFPLLHQDLIALKLPNLTSANYLGDTSSGVLTLTGGNQIAHLRFAGSYSLDSFSDYKRQCGDERHVETCLSDT